MIKLLLSIPLYLYLFSCNIFAAIPTPLQKLTYTNLAQLINIELSPQALTNKQIPNTLNFMRERTDANNIQHIRMQQHYLGIPIFGGNAILHKKQQHNLKLNGTIYQNLDQDLGDKAPYSQQITQQTLENFKSQWPTASITSEQISPIIYIDANQHANWAYKVQLFIQNANAIPEKPSAIIDANSQVPYISWDDIKTSRTLVKGLGYGGNQRIGLLKYGVNLPFLNLSFDDFMGICYMENRNSKIVDMQRRYEGENAAMAFTCPYVSKADAYWTGYNEDGYDHSNGGYSASNDALHIADTIRNMYKKVYGVDVLTDRQQPQQLVMRIHYGKEFGNAFWDGRQMTFGDGNHFLHPLVSMSIGAHEVSHGFTEQNSNLIYFGQSGAINESFSDMAAQAAEYYITKKNTWKIGQDVLKSTSLIDALRFMDRPSLDRRSIENAEQYREGMDVHYASGVFNRLFYLLATTRYWNTQKAFKVMLKANMDYWSENSDFRDAACGVIYAAEDYKYNTRDVQNALGKVFIDYGHC